MAKFDLTSKMSQYLDRHLIFPLLEFLTAKGVCIKKRNNIEVITMLHMYCRFTMKPNY